MALKNIIFQFERDGDIILMDGSLFGVTEYSGIESSDYELTTETNTNADGERLKRRHVLSRQIMVNFDYLLWDGISEMRQRLIGFFSPYRGGTLTVTYMDVTREIEYEVSSFKMNNTNVHDELSCLLYLKCLDPSFKSAQVSVPIMTLIGGWKWKFSLPFKMRQYGELKKNIYNSGHMETPVEIYFQGPASTPQITNHATGESIKVNRALTSDETLYINTGFQQKSVEVITASGREDAWDYLDKNTSDFFWLQPGDNMIEYSAGTLRSKGVEVYYRERYLGV